MPIVVKHSGNAAPTMYGAFGGGQGRRYAEDAKDAMARVEADKARGFQANQATLERFYRSVESAANRRFSADQAKLGFERQSGENALNRDFQADQSERGFERQSGENALNRDFQAGQNELGYQHQESMFDRQSALNKDVREQDWKRRREDFTFELTERQRQEDARLADSRADVMNNPDYTDDEKRSFAQRIDEKRANIQPVARRPKQGQLGPNGMPVGEVFNKNGWTFAVTDKGVERIGEDPNVLSGKDLAGVYAQAVALATNLEGVFDQKKADAYVQRFLAMHKSVVAGTFGQKERVAPPKATADDVDSVLDTAEKMLKGKMPKGPRPAAKSPEPGSFVVPSAPDPSGATQYPLPPQPPPPPAPIAPPYDRIDAIMAGDVYPSRPAAIGTRHGYPVALDQSGRSASGDQGGETRVSKDGRVLHVRKTASGRYEILGETTQGEQ